MLVSAAAEAAVHSCIARHPNPGFAFADFMIAKSMLCLPEVVTPALDTGRIWLDRVLGFCG